MYREVCRCPYCGKGKVVLEDSFPELMLQDKEICGTPCPHLACVSVGLAFDTVRMPGLKVATNARERDENWFWGLGIGLHQDTKPGSRPHELSVYVTDLACESLLEEYQPRRVSYRIAGGASWEREEVCSGSGIFVVTSHDEPPVQAQLDGWGIYALDPAAFVREASKRIGLN